MKSGTGDRWERLGALLIQRRTQLSPRFHNRGAFCEAAGLNYRIVYDIEEARRTNFGRSALAAIEAAYRLTPGAIGRFLAGGELEVQPVTADAAAAADTLAVRREAAGPDSPASATPLLARRGPAEGFPPATTPGIEERTNARADQVWTEVLAAQAAHKIHADLLTGAQVFGAGTDDARTWDLYRDVLSLPWRVRTVALTRAIAELAAGQNAS